MDELCVCGGTLANTGASDCDALFNVFRKAMMVPLFAEDGTRFGINIADAIDTAQYWIDHVNNDDPTKRLMPLQKMDFVDSVRADSPTEALDNGVELILRKGNRPFVADMLLLSATYADKIKNLACGSVGFYGVDTDGNLRGIQDPNFPGILFPIPIQKGSFEVTPIDKTNSAHARVRIGFQWDADVKDTDLRQIKASAIGTALLNLDGLLEIVPSSPSTTTTVITLTLKTCYGDFSEGEPIKRLTTGDFEVFNVTDTAAVVVNDATHQGDGVYDITMAVAQDSTDVLRLSVVAEGWNDEAVQAIEFTVP